MSDLLKLAEYLSAHRLDGEDVRKHGVYVGRLSLRSIKAVIKAALSEVEGNSEMKNSERQVWRDILRKALLEAGNE